jgi:hypothetical protein
MMVTRENMKQWRSGACIRAWKSSPADFVVSDPLVERCSSLSCFVVHESGHGIGVGQRGGKCVLQLSTVLASPDDDGPPEVKTHDFPMTGKIGCTLAWQGSHLLIGTTAGSIELHDFDRDRPKIAAPRATMQIPAADLAPWESCARPFAARAGQPSCITILRDSGRQRVAAAAGGELLLW